VRARVYARFTELRLVAKFHCIGGALRARIIIIRKTDDERGAPLPSSPRRPSRGPPLAARFPSLKTSSSPACRHRGGSRYYTVVCESPAFATGTGRGEEGCSCERAREWGVRGRSVGSTCAHTRGDTIAAAAAAAAGNSSRLSAISLLSRCGICTGATPGLIQLSRYLRNHECAPPSPLPPGRIPTVRFNTLRLLCLLAEISAIEERPGCDFRVCGI